MIKQMIKTEIEKMSKKDLFSYGDNLVNEYKKALEIGINQENAKTKLDVFLTCVFVLRLTGEFENHLREVI